MFTSEVEDMCFHFGMPGSSPARSSQIGGSSRVRLAPFPHETNADSLAGPLRVTTPLEREAFHPDFPIWHPQANFHFRSGLDRAGRFHQTSTQPLVLERLPQIEVGVSSTRSSTATKHLMRGFRRRSLPMLGLNKSGAKGGVVEVGVGSGCGAGADFAADFTAGDKPALIWRIARSSASSRFPAGASR